MDFLLLLFLEFSKNVMAFNFVMFGGARFATDAVGSFTGVFVCLFFHYSLEVCCEKCIIFGRKSSAVQMVPY